MLLTRAHFLFVKVLTTDVYYAVLYQKLVNLKNNLAWDSVVLCVSGENVQTIIETIDTYLLRKV